MQPTIEELAMLLGMKDIEIMLLQKQIKLLNERLIELEPEAKNKLEAVQ